MGDGPYYESRIHWIRASADPQRVKLRANLRKHERRAELLIPLVLIVLAVPVGLLIYHLDQRGNSLRQADHLVRTLSVDAANVRALEWKARALRQPTPQLLDEATTADLVLRSHVAALARNGEASNVVRLAHGYETVYRQLLAVTGTGDIAASGRMYATELVPA